MDVLDIALVLLGMALIHRVPAWGKIFGHMLWAGM